MKRLETIPASGIFLRYILIPGVGRVFLPYNSIYLPTIIGKTILGAYKDGIGFTKIIVDNTTLFTTPTDKHLGVNTTYGTVSYPTIFEGNELLVLLYQDTP